MGKDHDKIYIKTLMACFPMLDYHEAKVYVTSDCIMDSQQTNKSLDHSGDRANLEQPNVGEELQQKKEE